jgi:hypothetical protein
MPSDLMSLTLLVGLVGGALWIVVFIVVFIVVTVAAKTDPYDYDREVINSPRDKDSLEHQAKSHTRTNAA